MKHHGKNGKRAGPTGYRTASSFLHRKCTQNDRAKLKKPDRKSCGGGSCCQRDKKA